MSFTVTVLGSSGALPAYGRMPSSHHVLVQNSHCLIDCGEGTQMQLMKYQLPYHKIDHIFISHLHGDHYLGLMGLMFSMHLQHRTNPLHLYSVKGLDEIITLQLRHSRSALSFKTVFHTIEPTLSKVIYENEKFSVETIPLLHKLPCCGFLFREKPRPRNIDKTKLTGDIRLQDIATLKSGLDVVDENGKIIYKNEEYTLPGRRPLSYAYCSDTAYHETIVPQISGVELLYHEATFTGEHSGKARETLHSTAAEAAMIARKARAGNLLLGHYSARYKELNELLAEAANVFPKTMLANEGETIDLEKL